MYDKAFESKQLFMLFDIIDSMQRHLQKSLPEQMPSVLVHLLKRVFKSDLSFLDEEITIINLLTEIGNILITFINI